MPRKLLRAEYDSPLGKIVIALTHRKTSCQAIPYVTIISRTDWIATAEGY
jgi:hypothetical protein